MMAVTAIATIYAQDEPKFTVKPTGRILFDAAYINPQHQEDKLNSGAGIPDMRVGVSFSYDQWKGKVDIGYAYGKVNMKDVILQYDIDPLISYEVDTSSTSMATKAAPVRPSRRQWRNPSVMLCSTMTACLV